MTAQRLPRFRRNSGGYEAWVALTDTPLLVLAVAFIAVLALPYAVDLNRTEQIAITLANILIWAR